MERNETEIIKEAHLLCPLGEAWYQKEGKYFIFSLKREEPELCRAGDIQFLYDISPTEITKENITLATLRHELEACYQANTALSFLLDGLDQSLEEVRQVVIKRANELCQDETVRGFVREKLLSRPLPNEADIEGAIKIASELGKEGQQALAIYQSINPNKKIFIDSAPEDIEIAKDFKNSPNFKKSQLEIQNVKFIILDYQDDDPTKIFEKLKNNVMISCEIIIVYSKKVPLIWLEERIRCYQKFKVQFQLERIYISIISSIPKPTNMKLLHIDWQQKESLFYSY